MKLKTIPTFVLLLSFGTLPLFAGNVEVQYKDVESYRDFSVSGMSEEKTLPILKRELESVLERLGKKHVPEGYTFKMTITDIDMAGDVQPWRNRHNDDIRYVESIYPPRIKFDYQLLDNEGNVVAEDSVNYSDIGFLYTNVSISRFNDPFHYEVNLVKDWFRNKFENVIGE